MLEILINGERAGRVWKKARSIEVRNDETQESVAYISLSHYHKGQDQVSIQAWKNTRVDLDLNQWPNQAIVNARAINQKTWSFDPYGGEYSREGGQRKKLENLTKARDLLSNLILRLEAEEDLETRAERRLIIVSRYGIDSKEYLTKAEMIQRLALTDPELAQKKWDGAPSDIRNHLAPKTNTRGPLDFSDLDPSLTQVKEDQEAQAIDEIMTASIQAQKAQIEAQNKAELEEANKTAHPACVDCQALINEDLKQYCDWCETTGERDRPRILYEDSDQEGEVSLKEDEVRQFQVNGRVYFWTREELEYELGMSGPEAEEAWADFIPETDETPESQDIDEEESLTWKCPHCKSMVPETQYCLNCGKDMKGVNGYE